MTNKTLITALVTIALTALAAPSWAITTQEISDLGKAQVSDDIIITMIQNSPNVPTLSPQDVIALKDAGVGDSVVRYLLNSHAERQDAFNYDQAVRRQMLMNFQFPAGYFDNTYSGITHGVGGSLTPVQQFNPYVPYGYNGNQGPMSNGLLPQPAYGFGYYPDYLRQSLPGGGELNLNLPGGGNNTGILYNNLKWKDLWTWNFALYGTPPANKLYFRN